MKFRQFTFYFSLSPTHRKKKTIKFKPSVIEPHYLHLYQLRHHHPHLFALSETSQTDHRIHA